MRYFLISLLTACLVILPAFAATVPRPAPDLSFSLPNGQRVNLEGYKGKVIAVEFLLTTCPHCQRTSSTMQKLYQEYGAKGFQPLGVAINEGAAGLVPAYVRDLRISFPVGVGTHDQAISFLQHSMMMTLMMPQLVVIDKKGAIRAQYGGTDDFFRNDEANMRKLLERLLAE